MAKYPELATIAESGVPGYEANVWYGLVAPAKVPPEIVARLHKETAAVLADRRTTDKMDSNEFVPTLLGPDQFGEYIRSEIDKWGKVVKAIGATVN